MMKGNKYRLQMLGDADFDCIRKGTRSWRNTALLFAADVSGQGSWGFEHPCVGWASQGRVVGWQWL